MEMLVFAATGDEAQFIRPQDAALIITGSGAEHTATTVAAQLVSMQPWDRPRLVVHVGVARANDGELTQGAHTPARVRMADDPLDEVLRTQGGEDLTLVSSPNFLEAEVESGELVDREGFAFAVACQHVNVPFAIVRAPYHGEGLEAWHKAVESRAVTLAEWVRAIGSRLR